MVKVYKKDLCESYKDFSYIFDKDLDVYVIGNSPETTDKKVVFINITDQNQKDTIEDVMHYIDDYYNDDYELIDIDDDSYVEEGLELNEQDSLDELYGDIFLITLTLSENDENEYIEFNDIALAQNYIDGLKIDNDDFFKSAKLTDGEGNTLDYWEHR